jgi:hypothetical protein
MDFGIKATTLEEKNKIPDKANPQKDSFCTNCGQAHYRNRAKYIKVTHKFIGPNYGH